MASSSTRVVTSDLFHNSYSSEDLLSVDSSGIHLLGFCGLTEEAETSSANVEKGNWDPFGLDQVAMIRVEDTHPEWSQEVVGEGAGDDDADRLLEGVYIFYSEGEGTPSTGEEVIVVDSMKELEEQHKAYVTEYPDLKTEGGSYEFQLQFPTTEESKPPTGREHLRRPLAKKSRPDANQTQRNLQSAERSDNSVKSEDDVSQPGTNVRAKGVVCDLCPAPGRVFKSMAGFSVHLKQLHLNGLRKRFLCNMCQKHCRNQPALDDHIRWHASKAAVFQCPLCSFNAPCKIRKRGIKDRFNIRVHMEKEHPGVLPECKICGRTFQNLNSYLNDLVRHIGVTPFYCTECQIYEMTERGLLVHTRNHNQRLAQGGAEESTAESTATDTAM